MKITKTQQRVKAEAETADVGTAAARTKYYDENKE